MKFGGSSLASPTRIKSAARIVQHYSTENKIAVVVSAMGDTTDRLVEIGELAGKGNSRRAMALLSKVQSFHIDGARRVVEGKRRTELLDRIRILNHELEKTVDGIAHLRELTGRSRDYLISFGERLATPIFAQELRSLGLKARPITGGEAGITTDDSFGEAKPLHELSYNQLRTRLEKELTKKTIPVITGFVASSVDGNITTLGRGGSDYTASLVGAALSADEIWIWTDVDGLMTADPRIVKNARLLSSVSFGEALELSYFGAKMMHPRALQPASLWKIPVRIKNSFNPKKNGTLISTKESGDHRVVKAVTMIRDIGIVSVGGAGMVGAPGVAAKVFQTLGSGNINIIMISQGSSEATISFAILRRDLEKAVRALQLALLGQGYVEKVTSEKDTCILAVVGSGMKGTPGVAARIFKAVAERKINVRMVAQGSSEYNVSFVVGEREGPEAVRAIHEEFRLNER